MAGHVPSSDGELTLRPGAEGDAEVVAGLLYSTASGMYDGYIGGREAALRSLVAAYRRTGTNASHEIVTVAERFGEIAGAMATFPAHEGEWRANRFLRVTLRHSAPWHWPRIVRSFRLGADATPPIPVDALYVDALATNEAHRRRGVARALLSDAERIARRLGLSTIALDTAASNAAARALYELSGFEISARRAAVDGLPSIVGYVRRL